MKIFLIKILFFLILINNSLLNAEINIEAEPSGTIDYEYAIFKSTYTLPAKT